MAVNLSPVGGVAAQFFDNNGVILSGGKLFTYAAGTTTNQATYTASNGSTAHTNPIILNSAGRVPGGEIWLTNDISYKFLLKDSNDVLIATYDNISGISTLTLPISSNNITYTPAGAGAVATTVQTKLRQTVNVMDFGAVGDGVVNDANAFIAAINYAESLSYPIAINLGGNIYKINSALTVNPDRVQFWGTSATLDFSSIVSGSAISWIGIATAGEVIVGNEARCHLYGVKLVGNASITLCDVQSNTGTRDSRELSFEHVVFKTAAIGINLGNNGWKLQVRNFGFESCAISINEESSAVATNFGENNNFTSGLFSGGAGTIAFKSQNFSSDNHFHLCSFDTAVAVNISNGARAFLVGCHIETQNDEIVFSVEGDVTGLAQTFLSLKDCLLVLFDRFLSIFNCGTVYSVGNGGIDINTLALQGESTVITPNSLINGSGKTKVTSLACQFRFPAITISPFLNSTAYGGFEAANFAATDFEAVTPAYPPVIDTAVKRTGTSSLKMANVIGQIVGATLTKPVKPGQNVFLSLYYKLDTVSVGANAFNSFNIFAKVYDATDAVIATVNEEAYFTGTVDWAYYTSVVLRQTPMPAGAETIVITVAINNAGGGTAYVDDFVLNIID